MDPFWTDLLSGLNVIMFAALAVYSLRLMLREKELRWLRSMHFIIGAYWALLYLYLLFVDQAPLTALNFGAIFVRPAFTITAAVMLAGAIYRYRVGKK